MKEAWVPPSSFMPSRGPTFILGLKIPASEALYVAQAVEVALRGAQSLSIAAKSDADKVKASVPQSIVMGPEVIGLVTAVRAPPVDPISAVKVRL